MNPEDASITVVPTTGVTPAQSTANPGSQLPFDPRRLLGGILARRRWLPLAALVGAVLGLGAGFYRSETRYEVNVRLLRTEISSGIRASEFGDPFKPRAVTNGTLIGSALSDNVLRRVSEKSRPKVSLPLLRLSIDAKEQKSTDFVTLTVSGYHSREATVALANLWAQEIVQFSRELQVNESREVRMYVQRQIEQTDAEIQRISREITELAEREGIVDADRQAEACLRAINEISLRIESVRSELYAADLLIDSSEKELIRLFPIREQIEQLRRDLDHALANSGEGSAAVQALREQVVRQQRDFALQQKKDFNPAAFSGSLLASTLYMQLVGAKSKHETLVRQLPELERLKLDTQRQLAAIPEKSSRFAKLQQQRAEFEAPRRMLIARLTESRHFEENPPGYFQLFSPANPEAVAVRPRWLKLTVFGAAGLLCGLGLGLSAAVGGELIDSRLRTASEAGRVYRSPLWIALRRNDSRTTWRGAVERLWLQWISTRDGFAAPLALWSAQPGPAEELLWESVITEAERLLDGMLIVDAGEEWSPQLAALPIAAGEPIRGVQSLRVDPHTLSLADAQRLSARLAEIGQSTLVCVRFAGPVREPVTTLARACSPALVFVSADVARLDFWEAHASLLRTAVKPPAGLIVANESELFHAKAA